MKGNTPINFINQYVVFTIINLTYASVFVNIVHCIFDKIYLYDKSKVPFIVIFHNKIRRSDIKTPIFNRKDIENGCKDQLIERSGNISSFSELSEPPPMIMALGDILLLLQM